MDDLISRAAAVAQIKENYCDWCDHTDLCKSCETYDCIATIEQQVPAVDAVPVVHGRWVDEDFPYKAANANPRVTAICSECGNVAHRMEHGYSIFSKYCPACGAKMDGERRDSE